MGVRSLLFCGNCVVLGLDFLLWLLLSLLTCTCPCFCLCPSCGFGFMMEEVLQLLTLALAFALSPALGILPLPLLFFAAWVARFGVAVDSTVTPCKDSFLYWAVAWIGHAAVHLASFCLLSPFPLLSVPADCASLQQAPSAGSGMTSNSNNNNDGQRTTDDGRRTTDDGQRRRIYIYIYIYICIYFRGTYYMAFSIIYVYHI